MKPEPPNQYRFRAHGHLYTSSDVDGMNGAFSIPLQGFGHKVLANCIISDGKCDDVAPEIAGWEHVSVHIVEYGKQRTPTWKEMCAVKDLFWKPEECVVQFHPPQSLYVNNHPYVLHLWKWTKGEFPMPNPLTVGIKELGTLKQTHS